LDVLDNPVGKIQRALIALIRTEVIPAILTDGDLLPVYRPDEVGLRGPSFYSDNILLLRIVDARDWIVHAKFPLEVIENRKLYYQQALPEDWLTLFTHDPDVPWARLTESGGKITVRSM